MKSIQTSEDNIDKDCCVPWVDTVRSITSKPYWRIFISVFFTLLHDAAGLFSASPTIRNEFHILTAAPEESWKNVLIVVFPMIIVDCGSELLLVIFHDIPLCEKRELGMWRIRLGVVGQVITSLGWLTLTGFVLWDRIIDPCKNFYSDIPFSECPALTSGLSATICILMVCIKNSMTLKDYFDRAYKYPVICNESLLFLYHFLRGEPSEIVKDFKNFNNWGEDYEIECSNEPTYNAIFNFAFLILMDLAAIASVSTLIITPGDPGYLTFFKALPFVLLVLLDIGSELLILVYHDLPLCNHEDHKIIKHNKKFQAGRVIQIFVLICWIVALVYMCIAFSQLNCVENCQCVLVNPGLNCTTDLCPANGTCGNLNICSFIKIDLCVPTTVNSIIPNNSIVLQPDYPDFRIVNCTEFKNRPYKIKAEYCENVNPNLVSCVLLALILFEGLYETIGIFFKSYLLPITLPEYVMFQLYLLNDNIDALIARLGKNEFGFGWQSKPSVINDRIEEEMEKKEEPYSDVVALEEMGDENR